MGNQTKATEGERQSFIALTSSRGPGKRQIKPTAVVLGEEFMPDEEEEDDADFHASMSEMSSGGESSSSSDEDEEEEESDEKAEDAVETEASSSQPVNAPLVCSVCLNLRQSMKNEEVIQCDKCGIAVHELCYGSNYDQIGDETGSEHSSSNMEPWFCEPCLVGLNEPPYCEFCPNRYGAFKRSDIGGRWVHLVCVSYTHAINSTYGALEQMSAVSWQEMDHRIFGKKPCGICTDKLDARTGVTVNCDTGLCKQYFHATCAQKVGRLHDIYDELQSQEGASTSEDKDSALAFYLSCSKHYDPDTAKANTKAYLIFEKQEEQRLKKWRRKKLSEREERKRIEGLKKMKREHADLVGKTICWPMEHFDNWDRKTKRSRLLHTSPEFLEAFEQKAELCGVENETFRDRFHRLKPDDIFYLTPGCSDEFFSYVRHREEDVIKEEESRLEEIQKRVANLKETKDDPQEMKVELAETQKRHKALKAELQEAEGMNKRLMFALTTLGLKKRPSINMRSPTLTGPKPKMRKVEPPPKKLEKKEEKANGHHKPSGPKMCAECDQTTNEHLMTTCDECSRCYHLACCDPPLERMPKRSAKIGWMCHNCGEEDDEKEEKSLIIDGPRRLRQRSDVDKAKRMADMMEQNRAFNAAVRKDRRLNGSSEGLLKKKFCENGRSSRVSYEEIYLSEGEEIEEEL